MVKLCNSKNVNFTYTVHVCTVEHTILFYTMYMTWHFQVEKSTAKNKVRHIYICINLVHVYTWLRTSNYWIKN